MPPAMPSGTKTVWLHFEQDTDVAMPCFLAGFIGADPDQSLPSEDNTRRPGPQAGSYSGLFPMPFILRGRLTADKKNPRPTLD